VFEANAVTKDQVTNSLAHGGVSQMQCSGTGVRLFNDAI